MLRRSGRSSPRCDRRARRFTPRCAATASGTGDASTPTSPAVTRPLGRVLIQLLSRLVNAASDVTDEERSALNTFLRDWRPAMAAAPASATPPAPAPSPAAAPAPSPTTPAPARAPASFRRVRPAYGALNEDGSLPTIVADGTKLCSIELHNQFNAHWYWEDGARLTCDEEREHRATLNPLGLRADRPRGAATGPRGDDPIARAQDLIRANGVYESTLWRATRAQSGICHTTSCQFEATVLANGNAYCSFVCHTANAVARARAPTARFAQSGSAATQAAAPTPTPTPPPTPTPARRARGARPAAASTGASRGASAAAGANASARAVARARSPPARRQRQAPATQQHARAQRHRAREHEREYGDLAMLNAHGQLVGLTENEQMLQALALSEAEAMATKPAPALLPTPAQSPEPAPPPAPLVGTSPATAPVGRLRRQLRRLRGSD